VTSIAGMMTATEDPAELDKFATLGGAWWDTAGPMAPLHKLNPVRVQFIRDQACRHFHRDPGAFEPLRGLRVLDVGCGGGLLTEPLARLGALATGIDPLESSIEAARAHAQAGGLEVDYRTGSAEALAQQKERFDLVVASEVIEHVLEPADFTDALAAVTRPGGMLVVTTLSRTLASFAGAIVGAEYLLGWLPRGTHDWRRFLTPAELARLLRASGFRPVAVRGASYDGAHDEFRLERDPSVNYLLAAVRS
jgi:2-polyprenyl-6-hydroxyphenyl methylase/3-demethylubiquinone-9 3-methyltransferase